MERGKGGQFRPRYAPDEPRQCPRCERDLEAEHFYAKTRDEDGNIRTRQTLCKDCMREVQRERGGFKARSRESDEVRRLKRRERYLRMMADPERRERQREAKREQARRRRERAKTDAAVDAAIRAATKRHYDRIRNDPEAWQFKLEDQRIRYRGTNNPRFMHTVAVGAYRGPSYADTVEVGPFLSYVAGAFPDASPEQLEKVLGIPARRFREFIDEGKERVSLDLVDRAFTLGLGRPDLVTALYPYDGG